MIPGRKVSGDDEQDVLTTSTSNTEGKVKSDCGMAMAIDAVEDLKPADYDEKREEALQHPAFEGDCLEG